MTTTHDSSRRGTRQSAGSAAGALALVAAALLVGGIGLLSYALTSEYGAAPNGDLAADLTSGLLGLAPALGLVAALAWVGLAGVAPALPIRLRTGAAVAGVLLALVAAGGGTLLGQLALEQRCAERGASSSAACPRSS